jgi:cell division control protein CDC15
MHCKDFLYQCFQKQPELRTSAKQLLKHRWITSFKKNPTPFQIDPKQNLIHAIQVSGRSRNESAPPIIIDPFSNKNKKNQEPPTPAKKEPPLPAPPAPTAPKQVMIHTPKTKPGKSPEPIRKKTPSTNNNNNKGKPAEEDHKRNDSDEESLVNSDKDTPPKKITIGKSNKKLIKQPNKQKVTNAPKREKKNKPGNPRFRLRFPGDFRSGKIPFMN